MREETGAITSSVRNAVLRRFGLPSHSPADMQRLAALYAAWSAHVPFDNMRKTMALRGGADIPGMDVNDFFDSWLMHGTGATCWPSSNALFELLLADGFDVRRVAGSMRDVGEINHGSVKVRIESRDFLVDSSMLLGAPLELTSHHSRVGNDLWAEVEPDGDTPIVRYLVPPHMQGYPCRLRLDRVDFDFYNDRYRESATVSPFNAHLYARRNCDGGTVVLRGFTRYQVRGGRLFEAQLDADGIIAALISDIGIEASFVDEWVASGGLVVPA